MEIATYLYDADGTDQKIELQDASLEKLADSQLLWVNILKRDREIIERAASALELENVSVKSILNESERPKIDIFENYYRFFIVSVKTLDNEKFERVPIDFLVGKNFVVTVHNGEVDYFEEFREREKGETQIGKLDAESFVAALLDLHVVSYFRALEEIEHKVDELDEKILRTDLEDRDFLTEMVRIRKKVSNLRRWFLPHREVFYAFSRPDFQQIAQSDSVEHFKLLTVHFENAFEAIESSRETVLSLFDLYTTKSSQTTNYFVQRLTFLTLIMGAMGVIAGIMGMNYKEDFFESANGFWITLAGMLLVAISLTIFARYKKWI